jgi:hypothetical protein
VRTNDVAVPAPQTTYKTFDTTKMVFDFTPQTGSVLDGKAAGAPMTTPPPPLP